MCWSLDVLMFIPIYRCVLGSLVYINQLFVGMLIQNILRLVEGKSRIRDGLRNQPAIGHIKFNRCKIFGFYRSTCIQRERTTAHASLIQRSRDCGIRRRPRPADGRCNDRAVLGRDIFIKVRMCNSTFQGEIACLKQTTTDYRR
jgi:hypothetical protein